MATWAEGIKDAKAVVLEFVNEYQVLYEGHRNLSKANLIEKKLAIDFQLSVLALERVLDALNELQEP